MLTRVKNMIPHPIFHGGRQSQFNVEYPKFQGCLPVLRRQPLLLYIWIKPIHATQRVFSSSAVEAELCQIMLAGLS
jgi:hypothetical protein